MAGKTNSTVVKARQNQTIVAPPMPSLPEDFEERVRQRAYELWEASDCPQGFEAEHWHQAQRDVSALYGRPSAG